MEAVAAVDEARAPTEAERDEQMLHRGVTLATLRAVLAQVETPRMPTWQVVRDIVRPATRARRCRYVELLSDGVGRARVFVSHTWGAPFEDLVAAVAHALNGDETVPVWVDILAVRQWPGNVADLVFDLHLLASLFAAQQVWSRAASAPTATTNVSTQSRPLPPSASTARALRQP